MQWIPLSSRKCIHTYTDTQITRMSLAREREVQPFRVRTYIICKMFPSFCTFVAFHLFLRVGSASLEAFTICSRKNCRHRCLSPCFGFLRRPKLKLEILLKWRMCSFVMWSSRINWMPPRARFIKFFFLLLCVLFCRAASEQEWEKGNRKQFAVHHIIGYNSM